MTRVSAAAVVVAISMMALFPGAAYGQLQVALAGPAVADRSGTIRITSTVTPAGSASDTTTYLWQCIGTADVCSHLVTAGTGARRRDLALDGTTLAPDTAYALQLRVTRGAEEAVATYDLRVPARARGGSCTAVATGAGGQPVPEFYISCDGWSGTDLVYGMSQLLPSPSGTTERTLAVPSTDHNATVYLTPGVEGENAAAVAVDVYVQSGVDPVRVVVNATWTSATDAGETIANATGAPLAPAAPFATSGYPDAVDTACALLSHALSVGTLSGHPFNGISNASFLETTGGKMVSRLTAYHNLHTGSYTRLRLRRVEEALFHVVKTIGLTAGFTGSLRGNTTALATSLASERAQQQIPTGSKRAGLYLDFYSTLWLGEVTSVSAAVRRAFNETLPLLAALVMDGAVGGEVGGIDSSDTGNTIDSVVVEHVVCADAAGQNEQVLCELAGATALPAAARVFNVLAVRTPRGLFASPGVLGTTAARSLLSAPSARLVSSVCAVTLHVHNTSTVPAPEPIAVSDLAAPFVLTCDPVHTNIGSDVFRSCAFWNEAEARWDRDGVGFNVEAGECETLHFTEFGIFDVSKESDFEFGMVVFIALVGIVAIGLAVSGLCYLAHKVPYTDKEYVARVPHEELSYYSSISDSFTTAHPPSEDDHDHNGTADGGEASDV